MEISFIIPAYNEEKYIEKCVRSVFLQNDLPSFEVIVVDNNSTDNTSSIVQERFPQAKLVKESRQGMTIARNRGAKEAQGDILVFFDADDIIPKQWAGKILLYFKKYPACVGVSGPFRFYDLPWRYKFFEPLSYHIFYPFVNGLLRVLGGGGFWVGGNIAVKKEIFNKVGGFDENIIFYGEDVDLPSKMGKYGKTAFSQGLWVWSSARRLLKGNPFVQGFRYFFHYMNFFFTHKSKKNSYQEIR